MRLTGPIFIASFPVHIVVIWNEKSRRKSLLYQNNNFVPTFLLSIRKLMKLYIVHENGCFLSDP